MSEKERKPIVDDDAPILTDEVAARARPARELFTKKGIEMPRPRGRPKAASPKQQVTLRLDPEIIAHFKAGGSGWQTRINDTLLGAIGRQAGKGGRGAHESAISGRFTAVSARGRSTTSGKKRA